MPILSYSLTADGRSGHDDHLSVVEHLDELRTRLIVSLAALAVAFGFCLWQNHALLQLINRPLAHQTQKQVRDGHGPLGATYTVQQSARDVATQLQTVAGRCSRQRQRHRRSGHRSRRQPATSPARLARLSKPRRRATSR